MQRFERDIWQRRLDSGGRRQKIVPMDTGSDNIFCVPPSSETEAELILVLAWRNSPGDIGPAVGKKPNGKNKGATFIKGGQRPPAL